MNENLVNAVLETYKHIEYQIIQDKYNQNVPINFPKEIYFKFLRFTLPGSPHTGPLPLI